ncbi:lytic transglycosylase domain-containing protein [Paludicola sp. MB14-C6]|uniref:lytic transglycosylase domain-containing protein n=1 Tax=Paludihabitans sp. MB14-C6 TaxID=3070656 RepID=UPI0027DB9D2F|nr:lytic transglycosylase domain-containing protein [Paludicola sp. MB14-C6]WMJ22268.1 lytic transglycosylase domain-containing protein [Paludicola sp. MB14-C6]
MVIKLKWKPIIIVLILITLVILGWVGIQYSQRHFLKLVYKTDYSDIVTTYAKQYDLDPYLIYAVIKTESDFKKDAVSNVGARGLMQVMNDTYQWVNTKLKDKETSYDDMFEPDKNIKYGAFLLDYLVDEFKDYEAAIAAYHAGRGAVNNWLKDSKYSSNGKTLDKIPISDTDHYVHKVMKSYYKYKSIYENKGE